MGIGRKEEGEEGKREEGGERIAGYLFNLFKTS